MRKNLPLILFLTLVVPSLHSPPKSCSPCECHMTPKQELVADCSRRYLDRIPSSIPQSAAILLLHHNFIKDVYRSLQRFPNLTFLDLSSNEINSLHVDTFVSNTNLERLNLHNNNIPLNYTTYPKGLFRRQSSLVELDISRNVNVEDDTSYPEETLADLVSIQVFKVDGVPNAVFGEEFSKLIHLTNLTLSGKRGNCRIQHLSSRAFLYLPHLQFLDISKCFLLDIDKAAFQPLPKIDILDISDNPYLAFDRFGRSLYGLRYSSIRVIDASRIVPRFSIGVELKVEYIAYLNDTNVKHIKFDYNRLELIDSMVSLYFPHLESLSIKGNRFVFGAYLISTNLLKNLKDIFASDQYSSEVIHPFKSETNPSDVKKKTNWSQLCSLSNHKNTEKNQQNSLLNVLGRYNQESPSDQEVVMGDLRDTKPIHDRTQKSANLCPVAARVQSVFTQEKERRSMYAGMYIPLPPNLRYINISSSRLSYDIPKLPFSANKIRAIDLSSNIFANWNGPVTPMDDLEFLDISDNYCKYINRTFFHSTHHLLTLNISKNYLSSSLSSDADGEIFKNLSKLMTLRISHNSITYLSSVIFRNLDSLVSLNLSWNILSDWAPEITHMKGLKTLDVSGNRFEEIPRTLQDQIDAITQDGHHLYMYVRGNSLKCTCRSLNSLQWMLKSNVYFTDLNQTSCQLENQTYVTLSNLIEIVMKLQLNCKTTVPLIIGVASGLLMFIAIIMAGIAYRYRWKLRYLYYTTRRKYTQRQK